MYTKFNSIKIETNRMEKLNHNHLDKSTNESETNSAKTLRHFSKNGYR